MSKFKIALIQSNVTELKNQNLKNAEKLIIKAAKNGADIVVLPEMFICPYKSELFYQYAEKSDGYSVERLSKIAKENQIYLVAGSIPEIDKGKIYNTSFVFSSKGKMVAKHRKIHLFDIDIKGGIKFRESDYVSPGKEITVFESPWGKIGLAICFDIRFAEMFREMAFMGAKTIIVPAAFNMTTGPEHWQLIFRMRSIDNQVYMAGCAPARNLESGYISWAHSILTDPWGKVVDELETSEGILFQEIEHSYVDLIRQQLPILLGVKEKYFIKNNYS